MVVLQSEQARATTSKGKMHSCLIEVLSVLVAYKEIPFFVNKHPGFRPSNGERLNPL